MKFRDAVEGLIIYIITHVDFSSTGNAKQKSKDEQDQENPNDFRDPSVEEKERLLAVDKDITDEEDEDIVKDVVTDLKEAVSETTNLRLWERKLVCVDETSKVLTLTAISVLTLYNLVL